MELHVGDEEHHFSSSTYEKNELENLNIIVREIESLDEMSKAVEATGSCLKWNNLRKSLRKFQEDERTVFLGVENEYNGYVRAIEVKTSEGAALAIDGLKTIEEFNQEVFRASVNGAFRYAELENISTVIGGKGFFMDGPDRNIDLTYQENKLTPATETYFDNQISASEIDPEFKKPISNGERWDLHEEYYIRRL